MDRFARRRLVLASTMVGAAGCSFLVDSSSLEPNGDPVASPADASVGGDDAAKTEPSSDGSLADGGAAATDAATQDGGTVAADANDAAVTANLVAEWRFDEAPGATTAHDTSGHGHDARLIGNASFLTTGKYANCVVLNSDSDAVVVDDLANGAFPRSGTLSLWMKSALGGADTSSRGVVDDWDDSRDHVFMRRPAQFTDFQVSFQRAEAGASYPFSCTFGVSPNVWMHIVITWDETGAKAATYVDTLLVKGSAYFGGGFAPGDQMLRFGSAFRGSLDQVQLYDRALSAQEIATLK